jgi:aminoglycoside 2''-phosphotransferase
MCPASPPAKAVLSSGLHESLRKPDQSSSFDAALSWAIGILGETPAEITVNREGTSVDVLILDHRHVVRIARTDTAASQLASECALIEAIARHLPVKIPAVLASAPGWALQEFIAGEPLTRRRLAQLPAPRREEILGGIHNFLAAMTGLTLNLPPALAPHDPADFIKLREEAEALLFPRLSAALADDLRSLLDDQAQTPLDATRPGLIHGDLHPSHLLLDPQTQKLAGIIDFGLAGRADPAIDLAGLWYNWGDRAAAYLAEDPNLRQRASCYARTYEIQWAVTALRENRPDWMLYAMGAAKAIGGDGW